MQDYYRNKVKGQSHSELRKLHILSLFLNLFNKFNNTRTPFKTFKLLYLLELTDKVECICPHCIQEIPCDRIADCL